MEEESSDLQLDSFVESLWGPFLEKQRYFNGDIVAHVAPDHSAYLDYFRRQWDLIARQSDGRYVTVKCHQDVQDIARRVLDGEGRRAVLDWLLHSHQDQELSVERAEEACASSLNLVARLISMLKIGKVKHQSNPRGTLDWKEGSIHDFISEHFAEAPVLSCDGVRLPKAFDAWSIDKIGGIDIEFTNNLADHLLFVGDSKILIFHQATFLEFQQR
jgi:hypothetical protein